MSEYRISIVEKPQDWTPQSYSDGPDRATIVEDLRESMGLEEAIGFAISYNARATCQRTDTWAIIIDIKEDASHALECTQKCTLYAVLDRVLKPRGPVKPSEKTRKTRGNRRRE